MVKFKYIISLLFILTVGCNKNVKPPEKAEQRKADTVSVKKEKFDSFIFVGMIEHKPGLYKYDVEKKEYSEFWSNYNEQVVELSYSPDGKTAYFLTAGHFGKKNIFPYITRVKVYLINIDSSKVKFIKRVGDGVQVFTQWEDDYNFKVIINRIDKIVATYIKADTYIFNLFGKEILSEKQTYDITKTGYPRPKTRPVDYNSHSGKYNLVNNSSDSTNVYIENISESSTEFVFANEQKLNKFDWSPDEKYLVFSTINISAKNNTLKAKTPETSGLYIYDIPQNKIIKKWKGSGVKNFFIKNDLLIFDNGFDLNSTITIFDYKTLEPVDSIKVGRGCGLRNIPEIPNIKA
ncbi:MAG TPA: hypothetical protein VKA26_14240 [Ignavibacteriaceae bacterium]|nr:hypothetical protein [Ignavibacteriaceae bacterium]